MVGLSKVYYIGNKFLENGRGMCAIFWWLDISSADACSPNFKQKQGLWLTFS